MAAFLACAACCALPMLALAGGGVLASVAAFFTAGGELMAGLVAAGATFLFFAVRALRARRRCADTCQVDASCCDGNSGKAKVS